MATTNADPASRRERKKLQTRAALEAAALRLFAEQGYEQTTVEEIAEAADVAVRTFFRYFSSKQHVLFGEAGHLRISSLRSRLFERPADEPPLDSVQTVMESLDLLSPDEEEQIRVRLRLLAQQPSLMSTYLVLTHQVRQAVVEFVAARTGRSPAEDPYPLLVASASAAASDVALMVWFSSGGRRSLAELRREAFAALTAGIPPAPPPP